MNRNRSFAKMPLPYLVVAGLTVAAVAYGQSGPSKGMRTSSARLALPPAAPEEPANEGSNASASATVPVRLPTPIELLAYRVDALESDNVALRAELKKTQADLEKLTADYAISSRPPRGYTTTLITKDNFDNVEGSALMKFFVRP